MPIAMCFPIAPMKENTTEQDEGETGTGGHEAISTQNDEATGMYAKIIGVTFPSIFTTLFSHRIFVN